MREEIVQGGISEGRGKPREEEEGGKVESTVAGRFPSTPGGI